MNGKQDRLERLGNRWDCIVIGAGLAGTMAAREAALAGAKTLLVERHAFGRSKVCGACLNSRALQVLEKAGLASVVDQLHGERIDSFLLRGFGGMFERPLPMGLAVSRKRLDAALHDAAVKAGVTAITRVAAKVGGLSRSKQLRGVTLAIQGDSACYRDRSSDDEIHVSNIPDHLHAKVVIVADGLGHPSLRQNHEFSETISPRSYLGIGTFVEHGDESMPWVRAGRIHMAATRRGYGGLVSTENGGVNLAAAIEPQLLNSEGSPQNAFNWLLRSTGFPPLPQSELQQCNLRWHGTPALSRIINQVAAARILVVGDAAGYVEPFTGEGMAWALTGGHSVAKSALLCVEDQIDDASEEWIRAWKQLIRQRQRWCRHLAWLLRHPLAAKFGVSLASRFPEMTNAIVNQLNAELSA